MFDNIVEKINKFLMDKTYIKKEYDTIATYMMYNDLNMIFNYSFQKDLIPSDIISRHTEQYDFYEYSTLDITKTKTIKNLAVVRNNKPVLFASIYEYKSGDFKSLVESYKTYISDDHHIDLGINIETEVNGTKTKYVEITDRPLTSDIDYNKKSFKFYYDRTDKLINIKMDNNYYSNTNISTILALNSKYDSAISNIYNKVDEIIGIDVVKSYQVKRKLKNK